ncbi:MAG: winged helix-turn-helix transcriptional regulator [Tepidiformaceae bacterium]
MSIRRESPLSRCIQLFHNRWSVPIVATLYTDRICSFAELADRLNASRDTLTDTLAGLMVSGLVAAGPGPGRPQKAQYRLTPGGEIVGRACIGAVAVVVETGLRPIALKKWPMLVLIASGRGARRFGELQAALPGVTSRALALALKDLELNGMIDRAIGDGYPPAPAYRLTLLGEAVFPRMDALAAACERVPVPGGVPKE